MSLSHLSARHVAIQILVLCHSSQIHNLILMFFFQFFDHMYGTPIACASRFQCATWTKWLSSFGICWCVVVVSISYCLCSQCLFLTVPLSLDDVETSSSLVFPHTNQLAPEIVWPQANSKMLAVACSYKFPLVLSPFRGVDAKTSRLHLSPPNSKLQMPPHILSEKQKRIPLSLVMMEFYLWQ